MKKEKGDKKEKEEYKKETVENKKEEQPQLNIQNVGMRLDQNIIPVQETTELGESLRLLNEDIIESETGMSGIDMKSRLHPIEIANIVAFDTLIHLRLLPVSALGLTRQKKRISVSELGKGRGEYIQVVAGKRDVEEKTGFFGGIKRIFGKKEVS